MYISDQFEVIYSHNCGQIYSRYVARSLHAQWTHKFLTINTVTCVNICPGEIISSIRVIKK